MAERRIQTLTSAKGRVEREVWGLREERDQMKSFLERRKLLDYFWDSVPERQAYQPSESALLPKPAQKSKPVLSESKIQVTTIDGSKPKQDQEEISNL